MRVTNTTSEGQTGSKGRWLMMLVLTLGLVLSVAGVLPIHPAAANNQPITLTVTPTSETVQGGSSVRFTIAVGSLQNFCGTVNVGVTSISPNVSNGPTMHLSRYDVFACKNFPGTAWLTAGTSLSTPTGTYTITITGKGITGGEAFGMTHTVTATLTVT